MSLIYLASPYTHDCEAVQEGRFRAVVKVAADLMRDKKYIFSPIAHCHPISIYGLPAGWEFWAEYCRLMVSRCDEVVVLMMPGWEESKGISREVEIATELGKKVTYLPYEG